MSCFAVNAGPQDTGRPLIRVVHTIERRRSPHLVNSETSVPRVRGDGAFIVAEHEYFGGIHKRQGCDGRTCGRIAVSPGFALTRRESQASALITSGTMMALRVA